MNIYSILNIFKNLSRKIVFLLSLFLCVNAFAITEKTPVVFVHGLGGSATNFFMMKNYLKSQGWKDNELYALELPSKSGDNILNSGSIKNSVDQIIKTTGHNKVNIVAHSMGGANSLYYILFKGGQGKVEKLITLGGANRLVTFQAPSGVSVTSIYSSADTIVYPSLSMLNGAKNIQVNFVNHVGLLANNQVNLKILQALKN